MADDDINKPKDLGTGFNDEIAPQAGSGINVEALKEEEKEEEKKGRKFSTVVESFEEPKFEEYNDPLPPEAKVDQNKIPIAAPLKIKPNIKLPIPKGGKNKLLLIIAGVLVLIFVLLLAISRFRGNANKSPCGTKGDIVWWGITYEEEDLADLISEFESQNGGIKVNYRKQSTENYRERLTSTLAACEGPDIFEFHNSWPPMFVNDLATIPGNVMSQEEFLQTYYPVIVKDLVKQNGILGIPLEYDAITLFINETIFSSATREPPTTWIEVDELAKLFTQVDDRKNLIQAGIPLGNTTNVEHWQEILGLMLYQNGADLANPTIDLTGGAVGFYKEFVENDKVWSEGFPKSTIAFAKGQTPMYIGPSRRAVDIAGIDSNLRFKTVVIPQTPRDNPNLPAYSYATYWVEGVWNRSVNQEEAWKLLKFLSTKESLERINSKVKRRTSIERPFPRIDMSVLQNDDPIVGSVIKLAPFSRSWYLADRTYDGETGLNTQVAKVYEKLVNSKGKINTSFIQIAVTELSEILRTFSISR